MELCVNAFSGYSSFVCHKQPDACLSTTLQCSPFYFWLLILSHLAYANFLLISHICAMYVCQPFLNSITSKLSAQMFDSRNWSIPKYEPNTSNIWLWNATKNVLMILSQANTVSAFFSIRTENLLSTFDNFGVTKKVVLFICFHAFCVDLNGKNSFHQMHK